MNQLRLTQFFLRLTFFFISLTLLFGYSLSVSAHGPGLEKARQISELINKTGDRAELYIKRGRVYEDNHLWQKAMQDFDKAAELDPEYTEFDLDRARLSASAGEYMRALDFIDLYLMRQGKSTEALLIQARSFRHIDLHDKAIESYQQALNNLSGIDGRASPEWYIEYADTLLLTGRKSQALDVLKNGIDQLGAISVFQNKAIKLETELGRYDSALNRVDTLLSQSQRKDILLSRRADILLKAGRTKDAKQDYQKALAALQSLPSRLQKLPVSTQLAETLQTRLAD